MGFGGLVSETIAGRCHIAKVKWRWSHRRTKKMMGAPQDSLGTSTAASRMRHQLATLPVLPSIDSQSEKGHLSQRQGGNGKGWVTSHRPGVSGTGRVHADGVGKMGSTADEKGKINVPTRTAFTNEIGQTVPSVKEKSSAHLSRANALLHLDFGAASPGDDDWRRSPDGKKWPKGDGKLHLASHEPAGGSSMRVRICSAAAVLVSAG